MKQWTCLCGSKVFVLTSLQTLIVDFSREGAIEGHPNISRSNVGRQSIICSGCGTSVSDIVAEDMLKEII